MLRIIKTEFLKYKRYNILWIGIVSVFFSIVLAAFQLAGTNNSIITAISKNTSVDILGEANDSKGRKWYQVKVGGRTGYVWIIQ